LKENTQIDVLFHNKIPIGVELPLFSELKVVETDPGVKGNTASGGSKPARLETGATIQVPLFINEGDMVRINTKTGEYIERAG
jgi:elongation factor P